MLQSATTRNEAVLTSLLTDDMVPMRDLHNRYGALLKLVRVLIGVIPKCDQYLEIWPPAFRTYNIIVPNFMNLPSGIFGIGGAPKDIVGLGTYVASRSAECPYCSAHTCSYALRRGASEEKVASALVGGDQFTEQELATINVARSLARIPSELTIDDRRRLLSCFPESQAEWIVLGVAMMGFLNKFMDATGVDLEPSTVAETKTTLGTDWTAGKAGRNLDVNAPATPTPKADSLATKLSVIRYAPTALRLDKQWQKGVPAKWPEVGKYLQDLTGHNFPMLSRMHNARAIKAVASVLRENLNTQTTILGLDIKAMTGIVFANSVANTALSSEVRIIGNNFGFSTKQMDNVEHFALDPDNDVPDVDSKTRAALILAKAASPSPAEITSDVIDEVNNSTLTPAAIVELVCWLSVLQMLHRLSSFYSADFCD